MSEYEKLVSANGMLWALVKLRKQTKCAASGADLKVGDEAYRPVTNGPDRMKRIKPTAILQAVRSKS